MEKCSIPNCDNVARYFMARLLPLELPAADDPAAAEPYYYCEECRAVYPLSYTWLIPFEPFDWELETVNA